MFKNFRPCLKIMLSWCLILLFSGCNLIKLLKSNPSTNSAEEAAAPASVSIEEEEEPAAPTGAEILTPIIGSTMQWIDASLLVYIPPGEFIMGHDGADNPEHPVYLDGFWIYRTEVTNRMYLNCIAMEKCSPPAGDPAIPDIEDPDRADHPVVGLNWYQASEYCHFVDGSLPTEAQWEKAARGADARLYPWGDNDPICELLNSNECVGASTPVLDYPDGRSPYEVFDMAGNVFEWVNDWYQEEYYSDDHFDNPPGPGHGEFRSIRGSAFNSAADQLAIPLRSYLHPEEYRDNLGFRCVVGRAEEYAPVCTILAHSPEDGIGENPDDPPGGSASCIVQEPQLSVVTYCEDGLSGGNISWSPADAEVTYSTSEGVGCSQYDADTLACRGNYGATVELVACKSCPPPKVELGVLAVCDPPYILDEDTGFCRYDGPPAPDRVRCAPGYSLSGDDSCCVRESGTPLDFPICPPGGVFDPDSRICWFTLPSTGDEKCASESIYFMWCPREREREESDPCSKYTINECRLHPDACHWNSTAGICESN